MAKSNHRESSTRTVPDPHKLEAGEEPITPAQRATLERLTRAAGEDFDPDIMLTKAEAELEIEELQRAARRGETGGSVED
jgi:Protein of unknown function (DUF3072)